MRLILCASLRAEMLKSTQKSAIQSKTWHMIKRKTDYLIHRETNTVTHEFALGEINRLERKAETYYLLITHNDICGRRRDRHSFILAVGIIYRSGSFFGYIISYNKT
jgi:hypothetical protein